MDILSPESFEVFLEWIAQHHWLAIAFVCFISAAESLAVIGLFIPGLLMMSAIGGLASIGTLHFGYTMVAAIIGAIIGDGGSYWLGWHFKDRLLGWWPFCKYKTWLEKGQDFFNCHGGKSIVFGRFVGPVRPFIPVVAGMMGMLPRQFFVANVVSALLWAPIYMFPGLIIKPISDFLHNY